jgi:DNA polymerase III epsilon subunit-like protein
MSKPKILLIDIETKPLVLYGWGMFDQNFGLNQIKEDWSILSFSAKWLDKDGMIYADIRHKKDKTDDKALVKQLAELLSEADIVVGHNLKRFDRRKVNARIVFHNLPKPAPYREEDTLTIAKKHFGFTSNKLEYLAKFLGVKHKKLTERRFVGMDLWTACIDNNKEAWEEMERYNRRDVLALEGVYKRLAPWGTGINYAAYTDSTLDPCNCGSTVFTKRGYNYSNNGKYQRFQCTKCRAWASSKENLLTPEKRKSIRKKL